MNGIELKALWKTGQPSFGAWITLADPAVAAIMANAGFDWVYIDYEHNPFNPETLRNILLTLRDRGTVAIVRVRVVDEAIVKQVLDWGAEGILFPMIRTASDAQRAVAACRYPPAGVRGFNPREPSNFFKELDTYLATANDRILAILQVELAEAVTNLDEILRVPGIDGIMIGPADLS
jgi:2-keto-3-deoxy-L-rhamnonate aldolase RhmA